MARKQIKKPTAQISEKTYTVREMADFLHTTLPHFMPEFGEAFTRADIELALDDRGWLVPARAWTSADLDAQTRTVLVSKSRLYWQKDPLAKQAVRLWTDYTFGNGLTYSCQDQKVQKQLDQFCKSRANRRVMSAIGQRKSSNKLLVDGEVFFAIFGNSGDNKTIRRIDPLQIGDIITDPDDEEHVLGYRRLTANNDVMYYYDWAATDEDKALMDDQPDPETKGKIGSYSGKIQDDVVIYHLPFDTMLKRGNGILFTATDWSKEHRRFMECRVAITQALAKFASKISVKGGQAVVNAVAKQLASTYSTAGMNNIERNPPNSPGASFIRNEGLDIEPMPRATGAGDAEKDGNQLKLMVCAATGLMLHYFGDPSTGNLATATAMELPMLKMFSANQQLWMDAYRDIFSIILEEDPDNVEGMATIDIDLPPILADDLQKLGAFMTAVAGQFPEMKVPEILQMMLISMGVNNVPEVMEIIAKNKIALDAQAAKDKADNLKVAMAKAKSGNAGDPNVNPQGSRTSGVPTNPETGYGTTESIRELTGAFRLLAEKL